MDSLFLLASRRARAFVMLSRPADTVRPVLLFLLGGFLFGGGLLFSEVLLGVLVLVFLNAGINAYNDVHDVVIDRVSSPGRPLVSGLLSVVVARRFSFACLLVAVLLSVFAGAPFVVFSVFVGLAGFLYSSPLFRGSYRLFSAAVLLLGGTVVAPYLLGLWLGGGFVVGAWWFLGLVLLFVACLTGLKDFKDVVGDRLVGKRTLFGCCDAVVVLLSSSVLLLCCSLVLTAWFLSVYTVVGCVYLCFFVVRVLLRVREAEVVRRLAPRVFFGVNLLLLGVLLSSL